MYKEIFKRVIALISQPGRAWNMLAKKKEDNEEFLSRFVYPLIGMVTVAAFLGKSFSDKVFDVELSLKFAIKTLVSSFGGFYLASYVMNELWQSWLKRTKDLRLWQRFIGYASSLMFALNIVLALLPDFFFLRIFIFYTFYIVWEGVGSWLEVEDKIRLRFVTVITAVILLSPMIIGFVLALLMPGLHI